MVDSRHLLKSTKVANETLITEVRDGRKITSRYSASPPRGLVPVEARLKANSCAPSCPPSFASRGLCPPEAKEEKERKEKEDAAT